MQVLESSLSYYLYHWFLNDISFDWQAQKQESKQFEQNIDKRIPDLPDTKTHKAPPPPLSTHSHQSFLSYFIAGDRTDWSKNIQEVAAE